MQVVIICLMNSSKIIFVYITKIHAIHMIHHGNQQTNIKRNLSSNENAIDYRKQEPNTICYIEHSRQQKRNCLQMRIGPAIINNKDIIFKEKTIDGKTLLDVTFYLVNESEKKTSKTEISDIITKQFPPFEEFTIENGYD